MAVTGVPLIRPSALVSPDTKPPVFQLEGQRDRVVGRLSEMESGSGQ